MNKLRVQGVIFDMDNTLLSSSIDFAAMKRDVHAHLLRLGVWPDGEPPEGHTVSTMLERARLSGMTDDMCSVVMRIIERYEYEGMQGAQLEPGAAETLAALHGRCALAVLTNNAEAAALRALRDTGVDRYFDCIAGRERMEAMKPSPSGFLYILKQCKASSPGKWLAVGDSWIDGEAATLAGVPFVSYGGKRADMLARGVSPIGHLERLADIIHYAEGEG